MHGLYKELGSWLTGRFRAESQTLISRPKAPTVQRASALSKSSRWKAGSQLYTWGRVEVVNHLGVGGQCGRPVGNLPHNDLARKGGG
ncbi:hypothetical protein FKM82_022826 [Ascaphus truei]